MHAITLWRPWDYAITHLGKLVENRPRPPPSVLLGRRVAIHAGLDFRLDGFYWPPDVPKPDVKDAATWQEITGRAGKIVAVATIVGWLDSNRKTATGLNALPTAASHATEAQRQELDALKSDRWWLGPVGILLADVRPLPRPVPHRGAQGWWRIKEPALAEVLAQEVPQAKVAP